MDGEDFRLASPRVKSPVPVSSLDTTDDEFVLQIGERRFTTTYETLCESTFFASLFSGRCDNVREDGSIFIDADPDLFQHILRYLRRGVFPLFYDRSKGHDYNMYGALLGEARYFGIKKLQSWLENQKYLEAVKIRHWGPEEKSAGSYNKFQNANKNSNIEVEYFVNYVPVRVYVCPREISCHRGNPSWCGRKCLAELGDGSLKFEDQYELRVVAAKKEIVYCAEHVQKTGV